MFRQFFLILKTRKFKSEKISSPIHRKYESFYSKSDRFILDKGDDKYTLTDASGAKEEMAHYALKGKGLRNKSGGVWSLRGFTSENLKKNSIIYNNILASSYKTLSKTNSPVALALKDHLP